MELSANITATWKICTIASLIGCFMLLILLNENDQNISLSASTTVMLELSPLPQPDPLSIISTTSTLPSNFTTTTTQPLPQPEPLGIIATPLVQPSSNFTTTTALPLPQPEPFNFSVETQDPSRHFFSSNIKEKLSSENFDHNKKLSNNVSYVDNKIEKPRKKIEKKCNMFDGRWVYKPDANPSYLVSQCPFLEEKMSCQRNGRPNLEFQNWSWEARDCDIPLLNGTNMVEMFKNKRVVLVGDSLNRNMWESLACIIYSSISNASSKARLHSDGKRGHTFLRVKEEYNLTVEFFWSPFLIQHDVNHESGKKVLVLDKLSPNSESWLQADILVFNSAHWWGLQGKKKAWEMYEYKGMLIKDMPLHIAYKRAMNTWAKWVQKNIDPTKTTLFFRSVSAEHLAKQNDQWCYSKTKPIMDESYKPLFPISLIRAIEGIIKGMRKSQVQYLNITKLSEYRIDAHPSIYRYKDWKIRAKRDLRNLTTTADCGHWCLPGVPDTWNRLLYASLLFDPSGKFTSS